MKDTEYEALIREVSRLRVTAVKDLYDDEAWDEWVNAVNRLASYAMATNNHTNNEKA